jgi:serine/threonine-protein phosphatase PGAM5
MASRLLYLVRHGEAEELGTEVDDGALTELGKQQSKLIGERLGEVPFNAIYHSTLRRAVQTTELIAEYLHDVPIYPSDLLRDCIPSVPDRDLLSPAHAEFLDGLSQTALTEGPVRAAQAIERYAVATGEDQRTLIVTHNFLIGWFVRHALDAPSWRWMGLNQYNCALTIILYRPGRPSSLVSYNDMGHLSPSLRGLEHPPELRV